MEHLDHCAEMQQQNTPSLSAEYGINHRSPLLDLQYFDMCNGSLVSDVMHDLLEGLLQYQMKLLLQYYCIETCSFSVTKLCGIMDSFELGFMEVKNRPTPITRKVLRAKDILLTQNGTSVHTVHICMCNSNFTLGLCRCGQCTCSFTN